MGALLLLGMGLLSLTVIERMSQEMSRLTQLEEKVDLSHRMEYLITLQSHLRAMALLTQDESYNDRILTAKRTFLEYLDRVESLGGSAQADFFQSVRSADQRYAAAGDRVLAVQHAGDAAGAMQLHLAQEHAISHELETAMQRLQADAGQEMADAQNQFGMQRQLLTTMVGAFSVVSLILALVLGFVLSWAFIRPVRHIDSALARLAVGDFGQRVQVPNRDEFGTLSHNLNVTSRHLARLYNELRTLNDNLQDKVQEQVRQLERAGTLKRYLSPQLAESILAGTVGVTLASHRKNLTICFSDIRGFTALSERVEPEELLDWLNQYLATMTDIVFKYGGTLDKYIGDAIMVFFGDPIPYEDHAERAVKMALEMRATMERLRQQWLQDRGEALSIGIGISTGYVTVGNIGSPSRLEYTVLGNHVNLASRLAGRADAGQILISDRTLAAVRDLVDAREIDQVELKGVSRPIKIYEIEEKAVVAQAHSA
jgi:class 3 adenylate cyclase